MFPADELPPLVDDGWMLTGNATKADESSPPPPPPLVPLPRPPLMNALNGKSPLRPENSGGGSALRRLGVANDRTGVVRDSVCVVPAFVVCVGPSLSDRCCAFIVVVVVFLAPEMAAVVSSI